jgi:hypothetical protein
MFGTLAPVYALWTSPTSATTRRIGSAIYVNPTIAIIASVKGRNTIQSMNLKMLQLALNAKLASLPKTTNIKNKNNSVITTPPFFRKRNKEKCFFIGILYELPRAR